MITKMPKLFDIGFKGSKNTPKTGIVNMSIG